MFDRTRGLAASRFPARAAATTTSVALPVALVILAAGIRETRLPVLGILVAGFFAARWRGYETAAAWAAPLPVAVSLAWGVFPQPVALDRCTDPLSPTATWRLAEAALAIGTVVVVARLIGSGPRELGLIRPSRRLAFAALLASIGAAVFALTAGQRLAEPFFGSFELNIREPAAIVPALVFAVSNATMEELVYRGSLRAWIARSLGSRTFPRMATVTGAAWLGIVIQAVVFGLAHAGPDFVGPAIVVVVAMAGTGFAAALIVERTGSLAVPIAIHTAFDIPLYYYWACQVLH